jgi:hypothetical protein
MPNIEIKVRYSNLSGARQAAFRLGARLLWKDGYLK